MAASVAGRSHPPRVGRAATWLSGPISCCTAASRCCCPLLRDVFALRKEILGEDARQGIQTNLAVLPNDVLAWLHQEDVFLGVSWDGSVGARLDRAGRPTDDRVFANMRRAGERGVRFGVTLVLGVHNRSLLPAVYDRLEDLGAAWLNVVPLFLSSTPATAAPFALSPDETFGALVSFLSIGKSAGDVCRCSRWSARFGPFTIAKRGSGARQGTVPASPCIPTAI